LHSKIINKLSTTTKLKLKKLLETSFRIRFKKKVKLLQQQQHKKKQQQLKVAK